MTIQAKLRREVKGIGSLVHPVGTPVEMSSSELMSFVKLPDGREGRVPNEDLRTECEVPGCSQEADYVAPGHWCREHWTEWNDLRREDPDAPWMKEDRERPELLVTLRRGGARVTVLEERLIIWVWLEGEPTTIQVDRTDLNIECEWEGCADEARVWDPAYWCKPHYMEWLDGKKVEGVRDCGDPVPGWQTGPGAARPNNYPELSPREQWAVDKRLGILDAEW